jgi:excisionase family DNA binding protein
MSKRTKAMPSNRASSRENKRALTIWVEPSVWRSVSLLAIEQNVPKEQLLRNAIDAVLNQPEAAKQEQAPSVKRANDIYHEVDIVAERLQVSTRYVHTLMKRKHDPLPSIKLGRRRLVPVAALEQWAVSKARMS